MIYIYSVRNTINDKIYIGQTKDFKKRKREHKCFARYGSTLLLHKAIRKYGFSAFEFKIVGEAKTETQADIAEKLWIRWLKTRDSRFGYNLAEGGLVNRGFKLSSELRNSISTRHRKFWQTSKGKALRKEQSKRMQGRTLPLS